MRRCRLDAATIFLRKISVTTAFWLDKDMRPLCGYSQWIAGSGNDQIDQARGLDAGVDEGYAVFAGKEPRAGGGWQDRKSVV